MSKENKPDNGPQKSNISKIYTSKRLHKNDYKHSRFHLLTKFEDKQKPQNVNVIIDQDIGLFS